MAGAAALALSLGQAGARPALPETITVRTDTLYANRLARGGDVIDLWVEGPVAPAGYRMYYAEVTFTVGAIVDNGSASVGAVPGSSGGTVVPLMFYLNSPPNGRNTGGISTIGPEGGTYTLYQQTVDAAPMHLTMTLPGERNDQYRNLSFVVAWTAVSVPG